FLILLGIVGGLALAHAFRPAVGHSQAAAPPPAPNAHVAAPASSPVPAGDSGGSRTNDLLVGLVCILIGAKLAGELFERIGQPPVLGELLAGIALGNLGILGFHGLEFLRHDSVILFLSEVGVIILLFEVGLESNLAEMRRLGLASLLVATFGVL